MTNIQEKKDPFFRVVQYIQQFCFMTNSSTSCQVCHMNSFTNNFDKALIVKGQKRLVVNLTRI